MNVQNSLFMRAARHQPVERTPIWFMRQAGRVLPEYRAIRERYSLIEICRQPELCAEVTLQPIRHFGVDAAVMFADIMLPLIGVGVELELVDNVGPVINHPIQTAADLRVLRPIHPEADVPFILEAIRLVCRELDGRIPLIGFSGAPFTLASYLIEGRPTREFVKTRALMKGAPEVWHELMARLTSVVISYLRSQVSAGVDALQLFDSWVGYLSAAEYIEYVQPYVRHIFAAQQPSGLPFIHFGTNTAPLLHLMKDDGASIIGVDWRVPLDQAWQMIGHNLGIQGNLDPAALALAPAELEAAAADVLRRAADRPGHIFNLGHGLLPDSPIDNIIRLVAYVHSYQPQSAATAAPVR
jgi:uroporphyrinogen decarboxylase